MAHVYNNADKIWRVKRYLGGSPTFFAVLEYPYILAISLLLINYNYSNNIVTSPMYLRMPPPHIVANL